MAALHPEFEARGCRVIGLGVDPVERHRAWVEDIQAVHGHAVTYPLIGDEELQVAKLYGMLPADARPGARTAVDNATVRTVVVVGPDKRVKATIAYPMSTGRNFDEVLRLLDSLQLTARHAVATPVNWRPGEDVIIPTAVSDEEARATYPAGWTALTPYLRVVAQPR
jgi:alkyl hydroperoxide reductase subunit AhpC